MLTETLRACLIINVLKSSRLTSWTTAPEADIMVPDAEPTVDGEGVEVALLREERGKIWMRRQSESPFINLTWDAGKSQYVTSEGNADEMLILTTRLNREKRLPPISLTPLECQREKMLWPTIWFTRQNGKPTSM